jgi:hypothetical protein
MKLCPYREPWEAPCGNVIFRDGACFEHSRLKCTVCGEQALAGCDHGSAKVCGVPLCANAHCRETHRREHFR